MILTQALFGAGNTALRDVGRAHRCTSACLVPLAWLLGITFHWGLVGIWASRRRLRAGLLTATMTWKFRRGDWKTISHLTPAPRARVHPSVDGLVTGVHRAAID